MVLGYSARHSMKILRLGDESEIELLCRTVHRDGRHFHQQVWYCCMVAKAHHDSTHVVLLARPGQTAN